MAIHYAEFGGGLGDVFHQIFTGPYWHLLRDLSPEDRVRCAIICHNPHARELFEWHPKRAQMELLNFPYWNVKEDRKYRDRHNLPRLIVPSPFTPGPIEFYMSANETEKLAEFKKKLEGGPYVLFSATAGTLNRNFPRQLATELLTLMAKHVRVVLVGRNYRRNNRRLEWRAADLIDSLTPPSANILDVVDAFSVPGIANLLKGSAGLVTCHSALNILGWHFRTPQLLLYPEQVRRRHFVNPDGWAFGCHFPETVHSVFENYSDALVRQFLEKIRR